MSPKGGIGHLQSPEKCMANFEESECSLEGGLGTPLGTCWRGMVKVAEITDQATVVFVSFMTVVLVLVLLTGVIYRYVLNHALSWNDELGQFLLIGIVFFGAPVALKRGKHPGVTVLTTHVNGYAKSIIGIVRETLVGAYFFVFLISGLALLSGPRLPHATSLPISDAVPFASIAVGGALLLLQWTVATRKTMGKFIYLILPGAIVVGWLLYIVAEAPPPIISSIPFGLSLILLPILFALGAPIAVVLGFFAFLGFGFSGGLPISLFAQRVIAGIENPAFLAIPTFMLTGTLMEVTGLSARLVGGARAIVGRVRGGLAQADVIASALFADTSGSAVADTAAIGSVMMPEMISRGYDAQFATAHQAASGSLGTLFPPSISMIIYSTVASTSIIALFRQSIRPGILVAASYMLVAYIVSRRRQYPREMGNGVRGTLCLLYSSIPAIVAPVIVLGGILLGIFTPYESGAIAVAYVALVGTVVYRWTSFRGDRRSVNMGGITSDRMPVEYRRAFVTAIGTTAMVTFIIANATAFAFILLTLQLPQEITAGIALVSKNPLIILLLVSLFLVVLSIVLEPPAIIIGVVPLLLPMMTALGVSLVHFGVILMLASAAGMMLPPLGITLIVSAAISGVSIERAAMAALPYVAIAFLDLVLVVLLPGFFR